MFKGEIRRLSAVELELRKTFLDFSTRSAGNYSQSEMTKGAAYLVLSHAAIEEFFEGIAANIATRSEKKFKTTGKINKVIAFIMYEYGAKKNLPSELPTKDVHSSLVFSALGNYKRVVEANNGIKEHNLCRLFMPLGYAFDQVDPLLLPELDAFGSARGDLAHKSLKSKQFDPFTAQAQLERILALLSTFEISIDGFICTHAS